MTSGFPGEYSQRNNSQFASQVKRSRFRKAKLPMTYSCHLHWSSKKFAFIFIALMKMTVRHLKAQPYINITLFLAW